MLVGNLSNFLQGSLRLQTFLISGYQAGITGLSCEGDSGSPLVTFDSVTGQYTQVGVVSGGSCASYTDPGIFARLEHHSILKFIQDNAWDNMPTSSVKIIEKLVVETKSLRKELEELRLKNSDMSSKLDSCSSAKAPLIAFSAYTKSRSQITVAGNYLNFTHTWVNAGNHFDMSRGEFSVPIKGLYEFSFSGHTYEKEWCTIQVLKNGAEALEFLSGNNHYGNLASTWMMKLNANDKIRLKIVRGEIFSNGDAYYVFSGKLLAID